MRTGTLPDQRRDGHVVTRPAGDLPFTGLALGLVAASAVLVLAAGAALRLRARRGAR